MSDSININPVLIRNELINLQKHKLVTSKEGKNGGYFLKKPVPDIYLIDIYNTVKETALLNKSKIKPNPKCPVDR